VNKVIVESKELNEQIKQSTEYKRYLDAKKVLYADVYLCNKLKEYKNRNYELQSHLGVNLYDEVNALVREYEDVLNNSVVSEFLKAEQHICKMMQRVFDSITDGLELEYLNEQ